MDSQIAVRAYFPYPLNLQNNKKVCVQRVRSFLTRLNNHDFKILK